jgi:hypothetical protein
MQDAVAVTVGQATQQLVHDALDLGGAYTTQRRQTRLLNACTLE